VYGRPLGDDSVNRYIPLSVIVDGRRTTAYAHRLVYLWFRGDIPEGMEIDHIDGRKSNNRPSNLRVVTHSQNGMAAFENGQSLRAPFANRQRGGAHHNTRFTTAVVLEIRDRQASGESMRSLSREYGCSFSTVRRIVTREVWRHV
jgi:hypothetical protein